MRYENKNEKGVGNGISIREAERRYRNLGI